MIELPEEFKQNVINRYGKEGIEWLNSVDKIIEKYKNKFKLYNIKLAKNLTMNIILFASTEEYGEVIIKIGSPTKTTISEINYINKCPTQYFVKCYYYDIDDRIMILEKISPGYSLDYLESQEERIKIFSNIYHSIKTIDTDNKLFRSYEEILNEKIKIVRNDKLRYKDILYMLDIVIDLYNEIKCMNLPKCILHNDLQHKNILKSNSEWKVIDPHGRIGERIFETSMFIREELKYIDLDEMDTTVELISKYLREDKILIYKAMYITIFQKIIFYISTKYDNNTKIISYNIEICEKILEYLNKNKNI